MIDIWMLNVGSVVAIIKLLVGTLKGVSKKTMITWLAVLLVLEHFKMIACRVYDDFGEVYEDFLNSIEPISEFFDI